MKALTLNQSIISREALLHRAKQTPGAWNGIRIAAMLLILSGWKSSHVADLFGLSRWTVVKWIKYENRNGSEPMNIRVRRGRPPRLKKDIMRNLDEVLTKSPQEVGIPHTRWGGNVLVDYLERTYQIEINVRHAQRVLKKLGHSQGESIYR
jgi:transposase